MLHSRAVAAIDCLLESISKASVHVLFLSRYTTHTSYNLEIALRQSITSCGHAWQATLACIPQMCFSSGRGTLGGAVCGRSRRNGGERHAAGRRAAAARLVQRRAQCDCAAAQRRRAPDGGAPGRLRSPFWTRLRQCTRERHPGRDSCGFCLKLALVMSTYCSSVVSAGSRQGSSMVVSTSADGMVALTDTASGITADRFLCGTHGASRHRFVVWLRRT